MSEISTVAPNDAPEHELFVEPAETIDYQETLVAAYNTKQCRLLLAYE